MAEIDTSEEAVRKKITDLRKDDARSWEDHRDSADLLEALLARAEEAVARAEKAEGERDDALQIAGQTICGACGQPWTGETCGQKYNGHPYPTCYPVPSGKALTLALANAERDTTLARVAELEGEVSRMRAS